MKKIFLTLLIGFIIVLPSFAANWVQTSDDGKHFIDTNSISKYSLNNRYYVYSFWSKNLNDGSKSFQNSEKIYHSKIWYDMIMLLIDCNKKEIAVILYTSYDLSGNSITGASDTIDDYLLNWTPIIPDTMGEYIGKFICGTGTTIKLKKKR